MSDESFEDQYRRNIERRRNFRLDGYVSLADVGYDGEYVTPYQILSRSSRGPVLIGWHWLDAPTAMSNQALLSRLGYLPQIAFNKVIDRALELAGLDRSGIYMTQAFHLLPALRSATVPARHVDQSFDAISRHEIVGRRIIALGGEAIRACRRFGICCTETPHPSARGTSFEERARRLAAVLA